MNERVFEEMIALQKSLHWSRVLKAVSRGFVTVPLMLLLALWFLPVVWGYFIHLSQGDREGVLGYHLLLASTGVSFAPFLLVPLGAWAVFSGRCRKLERQLAELAASIR